MFDRNTKRDVTLEASRENSKPRAILKPRKVQHCSSTQATPYLEVLSLRQLDLLFYIATVLLLVRKTWLHICIFRYPDDWEASYISYHIIIIKIHLYCHKQL